ncbi:MAG: sterol desaturase family protein [Pseudomonadales bacterium]|nr:sterol desaturase family protein [Pseudomonadales bacterium]
MDIIENITAIISSLDTNTWMLIIGFDFLLIATFCRRGGLALLKNRKKDDWVLDLTGLFVQGTMIPWLQVAVVIAAMSSVFPELGGSLSWHPVVAFLFCFVVVDYGYYWNHRLFHTDKLWAIHKVHHTAPQMDVLTTSRNTLWTSLFIIYLWANGAMIYLLADPTVYLLAITITAILDLWRHSKLNPKGMLRNVLRTFLILPSDHAWHHSQDIYDVNFGANINWWDRIHGTWHDSEEQPKTIGLTTTMSIAERLWWPFK